MPVQGVQKLITTIDIMYLSRGTATSLEDPLNATTRQLDRGNTVAACNQLRPFINQVNDKETNGFNITASY